MISAYNSLISYKEDDWEEFLEKICLIDIFKLLFVVYPNKDTLRCVIRYIVSAYSVDSEAIIINTDWHKNKQSIFEKVMVSPRKNLYEELIHLQNPAVLETIQRWMDFQDNDTFKQLQILKDLRSEMQLSSVSKILKASGEVDYSQKFLNAKYSVELKGMIKDLESELLQNNIKLKEAYQEVKKARRNSSTIGVEQFAS